MKKLFPLLTIILSFSFLFHSCKKNAVEEQYIETVNPVIPDFSTQIVASVHGFITDENGNAIEGALVKGSFITVTTDSFGYFKISNGSFAKSAALVSITKPAYFTGYRTFLPVTGKESFIRLQLIPKSNTGTIDAATGGTVSTADGATVTIPSNAVVTASGNAPYTGIVNISAHWLNPEAQEITQWTMPGDLRGVDSVGHLKVLTTFGMIAVELTSNTGELLQIANGRKASLSFPLPASLQGSAPSSIPLWYFDEGNGLWKQEGNAVKSGSSYLGDVSHFSFWNCDVPSSLVNFSAQLVDLQLNPLENIMVSISIAGQPNSARTDYTDINGQVYGMIPANSNLIMQLNIPCNASVAVQNINTTNSDINLGSIKVDAGQNVATFRGTVNKCNGTPVADGYVIIAAGGVNAIVELQNGSFTKTYLICPGGTGSATAVDRENSTLTTSQTLTIASGLNDFGTLTACNPTAFETITYTLDGVTTTLALPQHIFTGTFDFTALSTTIGALDLINSVTVFSVDFNGPDTPGSYVSIGSILLDQIYYFNGTHSIEITNYGLIGQSIIGNIPPCIITDAGSNDHTFSCTFNIKRDS